MQWRMLGACVQAWNDAGQAVLEEVGELVCTRPESLISPNGVNLIR